MQYPKTRTDSTIDQYHGVQVADPYRWLEDADSAETAAWVHEQNELSASYLSAIPARAGFKKRLEALWDFQRRSTILHRGNAWFQFRNSGLENQDVLYVMDSPRGDGRVLLDPNALSTDGTAALNAWSISDDGRWLAYAVSRSGSDWQDWKVREVSTARDLPETLSWSKFSGAAWLPDGSGFFYGRYPEPKDGETYLEANYNHKLYFHRLATEQSNDMLVYERPDHPDWGLHAMVTDDGAYLIVSVTKGTDRSNLLFYKELAGDPLAGNFVEWISDFDAEYSFITNDGPIWYMQTNRDAPRGRIIAADIRKPAKDGWKDVVPEGADVLQYADAFDNQLVCVYMHDASERMECHSLGGGKLGDIALPGLGSVSYGYGSTLGGKRKDAEFFYLYHSFDTPLSVYRYDFASGKSELVFRPELDFDCTSLITRQVFVPSKDGTRIPMFITHRKGLAMDGSNPTVLYGYGGFNISLTPAFAVWRLAWLEKGGVYAVANLRGGNEYGESWHEAGTKLKKQNVFDDFIACAQWLVSEKFTSTKRLAIEGRSNGGLLVGACMTQRPDLFGACLPIVGVLDMLRFHKFTIGWAWTSDYGCSDNADEFKSLYAYSPYHNLKPDTAYPPTLVLTGDHDDRVVPGHSFKFAARLQACQAGDAPTLIRIQTKAGHGAGKPTSILIDEWADIYAFLARALGVA